MDPNSFPTRGNLILVKSSLALAHQGYVLIDGKRSILVRGLMELVDQTKGIRSEVDMTFQEAYLAPQMANIELGISHVQEISASIPTETGTRIKTRSVMGTEIPLVQHEETPVSLTYVYYSTKESLDKARARFEKMKELTIESSMVENSAYRLASNIKRTQKCTDALKSITTPMHDTPTKNISDALEKKGREEFTRLKVIKWNRIRAGQLK